MLAPLPEPTLPTLDAPYAMIVTGVGGTGVVTISAVLGQAAHLDGKGFGSIDMTGLAQKGGAVACHMRVARSADEIHAIRVGVGQCRSDHRRRSRRHRLEQDARDDAAGPHRGGGLDLRDDHRRLHPQFGAHGAGRELRTAIAERVGRHRST